VREFLILSRKPFSAADCTVNQDKLALTNWSLQPPKSASPRQKTTGDVVDFVVDFEAKHIFFRNTRVNGLG